MQTLACGELMPGCSQTFQGESDDEVWAQAGKHASEDHGLAVTPELVEQVRAHIRDDGSPAQQRA